MKAFIAKRADAAIPVGSRPGLAQGQNCTRRQEFVNRRHFAFGQDGGGPSLPS